MRARQRGLGGLQLLIITATAALLGAVVQPEFTDSTAANEALVAKESVAEALNFAIVSRDKVAKSFTDSHDLPRTASEAEPMKPALASKPEIVRALELQPDFSGNTVMIMAYLNDGVVENILGGEQYVYIAGIRSSENDATIEWQCGARNVDLNLLPDEC